MIRRMTWFDRYESAAASGCHLIVGQQLAFDDRAIILHLNDPRYQMQ